MVGVITRGQGTGTALLLAAFLLTAGVQLPVESQAAGPQVSELAPLFEVRDMAGKVHSLRQLKADRRPAILMFWALRCAECIREMAVLEELYNQFKDSKLAVLAVEAVGSTPEQIVEDLERLRLVDITPSYPIIPDPHTEMTGMFGVKKAPRTFVIDRDGVVVYTVDIFSRTTSAELIGRIEHIFNPSPVALEEPPPLLPPRQSPASGSERIAKVPAKTERELREEQIEKNRYFADFYKQRGELDRAMPFYRRCLELDRDNTSTRLSLGEIYVRKKMFAEARELWEEVLKLDPGNKEANAFIRRLVRGEL